jgi:hypothetical protein
MKPLHGGHPCKDGRQLFIKSLDFEASNIDLTCSRWCLQLPKSATYSYHQTVQLGYLLSELQAYYSAFAFQPLTNEPPDHVSVETGFIAFQPLASHCERSGISYLAKAGVALLRRVGLPPSGHSTLPILQEELKENEWSCADVGSEGQRG